MATRPNGTICDDAEALDERGVLRDGYHMAFRLDLLDGRSNPGSKFHDAKAAEPATIDEALKATFASMAESQNFKSVAEMLAEMSQDKIEETAAMVAAKFMSAVAGAGVAKFVGDAAGARATAISSAYRMRQDSARAIAEHKLRTAYLGDQAPTFADAQQRASAEPKALMDAALASAGARLNDWRR